MVRAYSENEKALLQALVGVANATSLLTTTDADCSDRASEDAAGFKQRWRLSQIARGDKVGWHAEQAL